MLVYLLGENGPNPLSRDIYGEPEGVFKVGVVKHWVPRETLFQPAEDLFLV